MSIPIRFLPVLACVLMLLDGRTAYAATPTPTLTPVPVSTATPVPPEPAVFDVIPWVNGRNSAREVTAKIGETLCATGVPTIIGGSRVVYQLSVPSEETVPGCGREGAAVTFFVEGQPAPQTGIWHSGMFQNLTIIIGPPFARFSGVAYANVRLGNETIVPYVGHESCGSKAPSQWIGIGPYYNYGAVVYSGEQQSGCGVEGSEVTFKLLDAQGNVVAVANQTATWHAWDGVSDPQRLDLTFGPVGGITMPGTGEGPQQGGNAWGRLWPVLGFVGAAGVAGGLAVRRRVLQRRG